MQETTPDKVVDPIEEAIATCMEWVVSLLRDSNNLHLLDKVEVLQTMAANQIRHKDNFHSNLLQTIPKTIMEAAMILKPSDINHQSKDISHLSNSQVSIRDHRHLRKSDLLVLLDTRKSEI